jgi:hypothetical protein
VVELISPMIFTYAVVETPPEARDGSDKSVRMRVPSKVWMAKRATAYITQENDKVILEAVLEEGASFPRGAGGNQFVIEQAQFGPVEMGSPIRENTKFMDVTQLKRLLAEPETSRKLQVMVRQFIQDEQRRRYFNDIQRSLTSELRSFRFIAETETLIVSGAELDVRSRGSELIVQHKSDPNVQAVTVIRESDGQIVSRDTAKQVRINVEPLDHEQGSADARMLVTANGYDVLVEADEDPAAHEKFPRPINIPMPKHLRDIEENDVPYYLHSRTASQQDQKALKKEHDKLIASIRSEMHARISFAVSCAVLVFLGCALGMISQSGNFLSAFAISVIPAMLCIALIVTGQHTCENTPKNTALGLWLIWSGNIATAILGGTLMYKLQRQ